MYPNEYTLDDRFLASREFLRWFAELKDTPTRRRVFDRLNRLLKGNPGDCKMIDRNLFELRMHFGPGYRVYFARQGRLHVLLLAGGDKWSQFRDIAHARQLLRNVKGKA
ncbi:MAG: type II toxin-antitoxin system RelE/ParE family toxin [Planctomycetota bacterium]